MIKVRNSKSREPALEIAVFVAILNTPFIVLLSLATEGHWKALACLMLGTSPLLAGLLIRRKVWSPASVQIIVNEVTEIQRKETFKKSNTLRVWNQN